jgi:hypothetical protein
VFGVSYRLAVEFYKKTFGLSVPTEEMMRRGEIATEFFVNGIDLFPSTKSVLEELQEMNLRLAASSVSPRTTDNRQPGVSRRVEFACLRRFTAVTKVAEPKPSSITIGETYEEICLNNYACSSVLRLSHPGASTREDTGCAKGEDLCEVKHIGSGNRPFYCWADHD